MIAFILNLLQWVNDTPFAETIRESEWVFPAFETIHVVAIVLVLGSISRLDMRLIGLTSRGRAVTEVSDEMLPWTWASFGIATVFGLLLFASKPIRYLVSSHPHFDAIGGIRTYLHIGATIITQRKNIAFLNHDVLNFRARTVAPDMVSMWPPTELAEGYNYEAFNERYVITDGTRSLHVYYVNPLRHAEGMAMVYLPGERLLLESDLFDTHEPPPATPTQAMTTMYRNMRTLNLDVATIVPVHGRPVPLSTFMSSMGSVAKDCPSAGSGGSVVWGPCASQGR